MTINTKPKISYLAITSLVLGLLFIVPLATGVLAIASGILAIIYIRKSDSVLLGKGMAISGISLGLIHSILWTLILYTDMTYIVNEGERAVIIRGDKVVRVAEPGINYKIPFLDYVNVFPMGIIYESTGETGRILFLSKQGAELSYLIIWSVCDPIKAYESYILFDKSRIEIRLDVRIKAAIRKLAIKYSDINTMLGDYESRITIESQLQKEFKERGLCLTGFHFKPVEADWGFNK